MATDFEQWCAAQDDDVTRDPIWGLECYRRALHLVVIAGEDVELAWRHPHATPLAGHLLRSVADVAAHLADGYGRTVPAERARAYGTAIGACRSAAVWYRASVHALPDGILTARLAQLATLRRMLLGLLSRASPPRPARPVVLPRGAPPFDVAPSMGRPQRGPG